MKKVAIITGSNSGVGFGIAKRLLLRQFCGISTDEHGRDITIIDSEADHVEYKIILACRNEKRATQARNLLLDEMLTVVGIKREKLLLELDIQLLTIDMSDTQSIQVAAREAKERFPIIDYLFCNAGIMPVTGLNWQGIVRDLFTNIYDLMTVGTNAFNQPIALKTSEGLGAIFAANAFGHYMLIRLLEKQLSASEDGRVIFTSSVTGSAHYFSENDIECTLGLRPYQSSKYVIDLLTLYLNKRLANKQIRVFTSCPGTAYTNIIGVPLPRWFMLGLYQALRIVMPEITVTSHCGSAAQFLLCQHKTSQLDPQFKYFSRADKFGYSFVSKIRLGEANATTFNVMQLTAERVGQYCDELIKQVSKHIINDDTKLLYR